MKKLLKYLVPLLGLVVLMTGCSKGTSLGEKKTVSEVNQLLTKKGQKFIADDYGFEVTSSNHLRAKSIINGNENNITFKRVGTTTSEKYPIYELQSYGNGSYDFLNDEKSVLFIRNIHGKKYLTIFNETDNSGKKVKLTNKLVDNYKKIKSTSGTDLKIEE